jgi:hypothetical protein
MDGSPERYARRPEKFLDVEEVQGRLTGAGKMRSGERPLDMHATMLHDAGVGGSPTAAHGRALVAG